MTCEENKIAGNLQTSILLYHFANFGNGSNDLREILYLDKVWLYFCTIRHYNKERT